MAKQQTPKAVVPNEGQPQKATKGHIVLNSFRDISNWDKVHEPGDDVSHFDAERLKTLVANGMVQAPKSTAKATVPAQPSTSTEPTEPTEVGDEGAGEVGDEGTGEGDNLD